MHTGTCGLTTGRAGEVEAWLFFTTIVLIVCGTVLATQNTMWVAIAAVAVADFGLVPSFLGQHQSHRPIILVVLMVHGACTAVAAGWSRRIRAGSPAARAKATEPGRILAGGWLVLLGVLVTVLSPAAMGVGEQR